MQLMLKPFQSTGKHAQIGSIVNKALTKTNYSNLPGTEIGSLIARDRRFTFFTGGGGGLVFQAGYILIIYYQIISNV